MALPKPSGEFEWVQESWGTSLRCVPLARIATHCFSTRALALEGIPGGDQANWTALARTLGAGVEGLVRMHQVHGTGVFDAGKGSRECPEADIAVTGDPSLALTVRTADCVPTLIADRRTGAVAAIHAGWKGTAAGAVQVAVRELERTYGSEPLDLVAAVGPSIGPCCYEVGDEIVPRFAAHPDAPRWFTGERKPRLDLWRATHDQLERAGLRAPQIHVCELCTFDHTALFHSYRRDGARAGRLVAGIRSGRLQPE